jgi:hypothetical protein
MNIKIEKLPRFSKSFKEIGTKQRTKIVTKVGEIGESNHYVWNYSNNSWSLQNYFNKQDDIMYDELWIKLTITQQFNLRNSFGCTYYISKEGEEEKRVTVKMLHCPYRNEDDVIISTELAKKLSLIEDDPIVIDRILNTNTKKLISHYNV